MLVLALALLPPQEFTHHPSLVAYSPIGESIEIGDIDQDGSPEVVVGGGGIVRFDRITGREFFAQAYVDPAEDFSLTTSMVIVDLDGDGDDDVVHAGEDLGHAVGWIENLGDGTRAPSRAIITTGFRARHLVVDDLDGDGVLDVAATVDLRRIEWSRGLGGGDFAPQVVVHTAPADLRSLAAADFDGDNDTDLVAAGGGSNEMMLIESLGAGAFATPTRLANLGSTGGRLRTPDVDGDGRPDLAATRFAGTVLAWARNAGGLAFDGYETIASPPTGRVIGHDWADTDGDGRADVAVAQELGHAVFVRRRLAGSFGPAITAVSGGSRPDVIRLADANADGHVDVVWTSGTRVHVTFAGINGFGETRRLDAPTWFAVPYDVDGDGIDDLVAASARSVAWSPGVDRLSDGPALYRSPAWSFPLDGVTGMVARDVDGDGVRDLVVSCETDDTSGERTSLQFFRGDASAGGFATPVEIWARDEVGEFRFALGDREGDGDLDVLIGLRTGFIGLYEDRYDWVDQTLPGVFTAGPSTTPVDGWGEEIRLADVDGDGDADLFAHRELLHYSYRLAWRENDGAGSLGPANVLVESDGLQIRGFEVEDFDDDGRAELVIAQASSLLYFPTDPAGGLGTPISIAPTGSWNLAGAIDLNADGRPDLLASAGAVSFIENLGGGSFAPPADLGASTLPAGDLVPFDRDGDGDVDVAGRSASGGWLENDARIGLPYCSPATPNSTGAAATMSAVGSRAVSVNDLTLVAESLPPFSFGYFLVSPNAGFMSMPGGSQGALCLGSPIGRVNRTSAEIFQAGNAGDVSVPLDLTDVPTPTGSISLAPGARLHFQAWYRDANPTVTSNFTTALVIDFE